MAEGRAVGAGDDQHLAGLHPDVLNEGNGCQRGRGLVGVGAAQHQEDPAGPAGIKEIDFRVKGGARKPRRVIGQLADLA